MENAYVVRDYPYEEKKKEKTIADLEKELIYIRKIAAAQNEALEKQYVLHAHAISKMEEFKNHMMSCADRIAGPCIIGFGIIIWLLWK